jgi:hypothetical protein
MGRRVARRARGRTRGADGCPRSNSPRRRRRRARLVGGRAALAEAEMTDLRSIGQRAGLCDLHRRTRILAGATDGLAPMEHDTIPSRFREFGCATRWNRPDLLSHSRVRRRSGSREFLGRIRRCQLRAGVTGRSTRPTQASPSSRVRRSVPRRSRRRTHDPRPPPRTSSSTGSS